MEVAIVGYYHLNRRASYGLSIIDEPNLVFINAINLADIPNIFLKHIVLEELGRFKKCSPMELEIVGIKTLGRVMDDIEKRKKEV